jgi:hypothetical protein
MIRSRAPAVRAPVLDVLGERRPHEDALERPGHRRRAVAGHAETLHRLRGTHIGCAGGPRCGRRDAERASLEKELDMTTATSRFTTEEARLLGETIGIDWATSPFALEEFRIGLEVELEHGSHDPETDVTGDDPVLTGKIAWAHLKELSDYYTRLTAMEAEAEA